MSAFSVGVVHPALGECDRYVGEDDVLFDWLVADNAEASDRREVLVSAPEGYVFNEDSAMVKYEPSYGEVQEVPNDYPAITQKAYVRSGPFLAGKVLLMLSESADVLTYVEEEDFAALNIDESRVRNVHFFYQ